MWWTLHTLTEGMNFYTHPGNMSRAINWQYRISSLNLYISLSNNTRQNFSHERIQAYSFGILYTDRIQGVAIQRNIIHKCIQFFCRVCIPLIGQHPTYFYKKLHYIMESEAYMLGLIWCIEYFFNRIWTRFQTESVKYKPHTA